MNYIIEYEQESIDIGINIMLKNNYFKAKNISSIIKFLFENKMKIKSYQIYEIKVLDSNSNIYNVTDNTSGAIRISA